MVGFAPMPGIYRLNYKRMYYGLLPVDYSLPKDRGITRIIDDNYTD